MASSSYVVEPGENLILTWSSPSGETTLYPQAKIYDKSGTLMDTVSLTHLNNGVYTGNSTALSSTGNYVAIIIVYTNSGHTVTSDVDQVINEPIHCGYGFRPSFGGSSATIDYSQISKVFDDLLKKKFEEILRELEKKSEFDPKKDIVITQQSNFRWLVDKMDSLIVEMKKGVKVSVQQKDYTLTLDKISKQKDEIIKEIKNNRQDLSPLIKTISDIKIEIPDRKESFEAEKVAELVNRKNAVIFSGMIKKIETLARMIMPFLNIKNAIEISQKRNKI